MGRNHTFAPGEWYHCYNRGVEKLKTFLKDHDFRRFLLQLYCSNSRTPYPNLTYRAESLADVIQRGARDPESLVNVGAYCLMPNHFHLLVQERIEGGIARFMQKLITGYTMYFNKRYQRTGPLFSGVFKSRHVADDRYLQHVVSYIHLNPLDLPTISPRSIYSYPFSSLLDFTRNAKRIERAILSDVIFDCTDQGERVSEMMKSSALYADAATTMLK